MKKFTGTYTAIITPFQEDESVDYDTLGVLIEEQIAAGITGIVVIGTTGESPTLSPEEDQQIIQFAVQAVSGRCAVIAGTGSNSTAEAVKYSNNAERLGVDALMIVNPYYNKPTQEGLFLHFTAVAKDIDLPIILYNIKGRTGVNVETDTLLRIVDAAPNVCCVKEASGDLHQMKDVITRTGVDFSVLSGDDNMTNDLIAAGGDGVISVLSNIVPDRVKAMVDAGLAGRRVDADTLHAELIPLMEGCFIETNPIPVKTALALQGKCKEVFRLPMCAMSDENKAKWRKILEERNVL